MYGETIKPIPGYVDAIAGDMAGWIFHLTC